MSQDAKKLQAAYDELIDGFVQPLVCGGQISLGRPAAPGALPYFADARATSGQAETDIFDALHRAASVVAHVEDVPWPSADLLAIAMALHDLAFLTDPELDQAFSRSARPVILGWVDQLTSAIAPPRTRGDALARHALLQAFFDTKRKDETVRNWAYTYRYQGRAVPWNVVAMPKVRFVRREERLVDVSTMIEDPNNPLDLAPRLRALVARSPVTELLVADRFTPSYFSFAALAVLSDRALRGGIARSVAAQGEWRVASVFGRALVHPSLSSAPPAYAETALRFLLEIHLCALLDARARPTKPDSLDDGGVRFAAVLPAFLEDDVAMEELRALDDGDRAALQRRAIELRRLVPKKIFADVAALVRTSLRAAKRAGPPDSMALSATQVSEVET